jgi:hypothetical protein
MRTPLVVTYTLFLIAAIAYACIKPTWNVAQLAITVIAGLGQSGPLTLLVACVQFSSPHAYLSTATGLAFSARAIGGAFGSAVINAIINGRLNSHYANDVGSAAIAAGLPASSVGDLLTTMAAPTGPAADGLTPEIMAAVMDASHWSYARAYRLGWWSVVPFVVLAIIAVACLRNVSDLMTEKVEATVERTSSDEEKKVVE